MLCWVVEKDDIIYIEEQNNAIIVSEETGFSRDILEAKISQYSCEFL